MRGLILLFITVTIVSVFTGCTEKKKYKEKYYQTLLCDDLNGVMTLSLGPIKIKPTFIDILFPGIEQVLEIYTYQIE